MYTVENATVPEEKPIMSQCAVYLCERKYTSNYYSASKLNFRLYKSQQLVLGRASDHEIKLTPPNGSETLSANSTYAMYDASLADLKIVLRRVFHITSYRGDPSIIGVLYNVSDLNEAQEGSLEDDNA